MTETELTAQIERLEGLMAKATQGEWEARRAAKPDNCGGYDWAIIAPGKAIIGECFQVVDYADSSATAFDCRPVEANAALIVEAINALPALIAAIKEKM